MKIIKINKVIFRGQYAEALEQLQKGNSLTVNNFKNGSWEATTKISRFAQLLNTAKLSYRNIGGNSLRTMEISL